MKKKLPWYLEYFLEDILWWNKRYSVRKIFWSYWIFRDKKIFAIFSGWEFYFRKNIFLLENKQMFYFKKWEKTFLPYFLIDENLLENFDELQKYIDLSIDY